MRRSEGRSSDLRVGVDVGGTFTDLIGLQSDGGVVARKVLSTPPDFSHAIEVGLRALLSDLGAAAEQIGGFVHGATVATNAIITRSGARTGLITSQGFRDVLEARRMRVPQLYDVEWEKPAPLVPRHLRMTVPGRADPQGAHQVPLDEKAVRLAVRKLRRAGVESIAVCLLHSYANPEQERRVRELIREMAPKTYASLGAELLGEIKEYDRTSTAVVNAYIQPVVDRYLAEMQGSLRNLGVRAPILVMQSSGGMMPVDRARDRPVHTIESGPAAGVTGAFHLSQRMGLVDVITLDMGGTTAKAALIEDGKLTLSPEYEVGSSMSFGHRLMKGRGYLVRVPSLDIAEVGAGGGSIAWSDSGSALKVGPQSAGADPGPACYGLGGTRPTVTDADVYLGSINDEHLAGGALRIDRGLAEKALRDGVAQPLGLEMVQAASGVRSVAESSLVRAVRAVSTDRGRDPRRFALMAFGGMGPAHAANIAADLGISRVIIPILPGLWSALGLLFAKVEHTLVRTCYLPCTPQSATAIAKTLGELTDESLAQLADEGLASAQVTVQLAADVRYVGQDYALTVPLDVRLIDRGSLETLRERFHDQHRHEYGYAAEQEDVQIVSLRAVARGGGEQIRVPERLTRAGRPGANGKRDRRAYFGHEIGWVSLPLIWRDALSDKPTAGPMVIEEDDSSSLVPPGWSAATDEWSNIVLQPEPSKARH